MVRESVLEYFAEKADRYDDVDEQIYWRLSDSLLWSTLSNEIIPEIEADEPSVLDAGGGTGRWILRTLDTYPEMSGVLFDLSPEMLSQAEAKIRGDELTDRLEIVQGDLLEIGSSLPTDFDLVYCFHNVLGFVSDPDRVIENLSKRLDEGGWLICFAPNQYHGVYFNTKTGRLDVANRIATERVGTFTDGMPEMNFFTPTNLEDMIESAGLDPVMTRGMPVSIYPGIEETQIEGTTHSIADLLSDEDRFEDVLSIERRLSRQEDAAARGNNLFIAAQKP